MRPSVFASFLALTKPLEGVCTWLYPDALGLVSTGIGNLVDPVALALSLPWFHQSTGARATSNEIRTAWQTVKSSGLGGLGGLGGGSARVQMLTDLRLLESDVDALVEAKAAGNDAELAAHFENWDELPDAAQVGTHLLAWACGAGAITTPGPKHFPLFAAALARCDFYACARECLMPAAANPGNNLTKRNAVTSAQFMSAAVGALTMPPPD